MIRSPSRLTRSQTGLAALAALVLLAAAGCAEKHIGRRCVIPVDGGAAQSPTNFSVNPLALECPSRICIRPAEQKSTDTQALCTDECSNDDDCSGGETRDEKDKTDLRCTQGFTCRTAIPKLTDVPLACKKVCVCKDFVIGTKDVKPESCQ